MHTNIVSIALGIDFDRIGTTMMFMYDYPIDVVYYMVYDEQVRYILSSIVEIPIEVDITLNDEEDVIRIEFV